MKVTHVRLPLFEPFDFVYSDIINKKSITLLSTINERFVKGGGTDVPIYVISAQEHMIKC